MTFSYPERLDSVSKLKDLVVFSTKFLRKALAKQGNEKSKFLILN
jgi:hypothetical protein